MPTGVPRPHCMTRKRGLWFHPRARVTALGWPRTLNAGKRLVPASKPKRNEMDRNNFSRLDAMIAVTLAVIVMAWFVTFAAVWLLGAVV